MKKITLLLKSSKTKMVMLLSTALLFTMCITIDMVSEPSNITTDSTIAVTLDATLVGEVDDAGQWLYVAFLAPSAWDLENNDNLTGTYEYTSSLGGTVMGTLAVPPGDDPGPQNPPGGGGPGTQTWEESCNQAFGFASNNPADVKWVMLRNVGAKIPVANGEELAGTITLNINVGPDPVTTEFGYALLLGNYDFDNPDHWDLQFTGSKGITLGTEKVALIEASFYPNPTNDVLTITSKEPLSKVEFYSISGQKVKEINSNFEAISTKDLSSGMYIVKALSDKGSATAKLIKE